MKAILLFASAAAWSVSAIAAPDVARCDAKPFTLAKPAASQPRADAGPKAQLPAKPKTATSASTKPRLLATCKDKSRKS
jgi:hypothetical protein